MFEGPPGHMVQRHEPYILPRTSHFPLAGAVCLRQPCRALTPGKTDGPPRPPDAAGSAPPDRGGLVPADGVVLVGKPSPPFVQINWGRAKRGRVQFGPGGFRASGLLLLSHFIIMNNKEILTHGFCKLFIACTEKSGQQYVKQTTCMSALVEGARQGPRQVLWGPLIRGEAQGLRLEVTGRRSSCHRPASAGPYQQCFPGRSGAGSGPLRTGVTRSAFVARTHSSEPHRCEHTGVPVTRAEVFRLGWHRPPVP